MIFSRAHLKKAQIIIIISSSPVVFVAAEAVTGLYASQWVLLQFNGQRRWWQWHRIMGWVARMTRMVRLSDRKKWNCPRASVGNVFRGRMYSWTSKIHKLKRRRKIVGMWRGHPGIMKNEYFLFLLVWMVISKSVSGKLWMPNSPFMGNCCGQLDGRQYPPEHCIKVGGLRWIEWV